MRKIFIGADGAGFPLKEEIRDYLKGKGYDVTDFGHDSTSSCHYPEYASKVCKEVQKDPDNTFGILICGTGIGMSMCANKYNGIRAALCSDTYSAKMTRLHNDANVLAIGGGMVGKNMALDIVETFLNTEFSEGENHIRRIGLIE